MIQLIGPVSGAAASGAGADDASVDASKLRLLDLGSGRGGDIHKWKI